MKGNAKKEIKAEDEEMNGKTESPIKSDQTQLKKRKIESSEGQPLKKQKKETTVDKGLSEIHEEVNDEGVSASQKRKHEKLEKIKTRNPAADFVTQCNVFYNALLNSKGDSTEERQQRVQDCLDFVDGFDIQSSDAFAGKARLLGVNRCLQICYKFGSPTQKKFMTEKLENEFVRMATTATGMHLCQKMIKYSDEEVKKSLSEKLITHNNVDLFYSKFGSTVVAAAVSLNDTISAPYRRQLLSRLTIPKTILVQIPDIEGMSPSAVYGKSDDRGKKQIKENLERVLSRCVDKELADRGYFHEVFDFFSSIATDEELQSMLDSLADCLPLLLSTRVGCLTVCRLLNVADAKRRKKFLQACRDASISPLDIALNSVSSIVILKLLSCVDDTKLLKESVLSPILNFEVKSIKPSEKEDGTTLMNLAGDKAGRKVLLMLFSDDCNRYFNQEEKRLVMAQSPTSKKDPEVRRNELLDFVKKAFHWVIMNRNDHNEFINTWINNREARDVFVEYLNKTKDNEVVDKLFESLQTLKSEDRLVELFDHQTGQRTLVSLLRIGAPLNVKSNDNNQNDDQIMEGVSTDDLLKNSDGQTFHEFLCDLISVKQPLPRILETRGVFVIVDLYTIMKRLELKPKNEMTRFSQFCLKSLTKLKSQDTSGVRLLKSRLSES